MSRTPTLTIHDSRSTRVSCRHQDREKNSCAARHLFLHGTSFFVGLIFSISLSSQDLGKGFSDHGVASPISNHRGTVATTDGDGRNVVLVWLFDYRGGYALLMIDAETGKSEEFPLPFAPGRDTPYSSILSSENKFYTLFNGNFVEFDPVRRAFTFHHTTMPKMAMGMTEDDNGIIWAVTYPNSGVVSYNPYTSEIKDYGYVYRQNWLQYQRFVAADDSGWIYFAVGNTASQIIAFDPVSGQGKPVLQEPSRKRGMAYVYRNMNGKVYGQALQDPKEDWYELHRGNALKVSGHDPRPKEIITGSQSLFHVRFPDGKIIQSCDLVERKLVVADSKTGNTRDVRFEYTSEGAWVMGVAAAPDGTISGGTAFPMRYFGYDPRTNTWVNRPAYGQFNTVARQGKHFFFGVYPHGILLEWDPFKPWITTEKNKPGTNPLYLTDVSPVINRPHRLVAHPDKKTIIMSGTPEYGYTGGGLLIWDREKNTQTVLKDTDIIPNQSTMSLAVLPKRKLLGGTTTSPGTGGEKKAEEAEVYIIDMMSKRVEWRSVLFPGVQEYSDMCTGSGGLVYGIADKKKFFVFDPEKKKVVHEYDVGELFGPTTAEQSPRIFVFGPEKEIYLLFVKGIVKLDPVSFRLEMIAESPVPIQAGGDYFEGHIYFVNGSHLYSYKLND
ncbi:MAG: hypothetical protein WD824_11900 [Cyclobacteriaceae bacterium]